MWITDRRAAQVPIFDTRKHSLMTFLPIPAKDCMPVYWIWQKSAFILGGLFLPIEVYPAWLQKIAFWSPFSAMMHGPGRMAFGWQPEEAGLIALKLIAWLGIGSALVIWTQRRGLRVLDINGG